MNHPILLGLSLAILASPAFAAAFDKRQERDLSRAGVVCIESAEAAEPGETHSCYFRPVQVGDKDYSVRATRSMQVVTSMGQDCDELEILNDLPWSRDGEAEPSLRRVHVKCVD